MAGKPNRAQGALVVVVLLVGLLMPGTVSAGPYIGEWGYCWKPAKDCPKGGYCWLHYWAPAVYRVKYCLFPAHVDGYPPGVPVPTTWQLQPDVCRTRPPMPTDPYGDPAGFYGRPLVPSEEEAKEKAAASEKK
jgi:hypothetical protein